MSKNRTPRTTPAGGKPLSQRLLDCRYCGACCCNTLQNEAEGYRFYVEIDDERSALLSRKELQKWVVRDEDGVPHLRMDPSGRCSALVGKLGALVTCRVYDHRPSACRRVEPGDAECLRARAERGFE